MLRARFELEASDRTRSWMSKTPAFVFFQAMSPNLICIDLCLIRCSANWRVSRNHIVRASTSSSWTPNWFSLKNAFNIFVCESYCGVRFVSFTLFPEFLAFAFRDVPGYLEFFVLENVYLRVIFTEESLDTSREGGHCVSCVFWIVLFRCSYIKIAPQPVQLFWGDFLDLSFFSHFWNTFIS